MRKPRGEKPHLRQRGVSGWELTYRGRTVTFRARGKTEARRLADDYCALQERIRLGLEKAVVPQTLLEAFQEYSKTASAKASWAMEKGRWHRHILQLDEKGRAHAPLAHKLLHTITTHDVEVLLLAKHREGYSPQTVAHLRTHLRRLLTWAIREWNVLRGENVASLAKLPEPVPEPSPKALSPEQLEALFREGTTNDNDRLLLLTATYTGERRKELLHLLWDNVDERAGWLFVENSQRVKTKGRKSRAIPIHPDLLPYIQAARKSATSVYVFPDKRGELRSRHFKAADFLRSCLVRAGLVQGYQLVCQKRTRNNPRQKLSAAQAKSVRERAGQGEDKHALAAAFGVSPRAVALILSGKSHPVGFRPPGKCGWVSKELAPEPAIAPCPVCGATARPRPVPLAFTFKDLRSTFGTYVVEAAGLRAGQLLLGHADHDTTDRSYAKRRQPFLQAALAAVRFLPADKLPIATAAHPPLLPASTIDPPP